LVLRPVVTLTVAAMLPVCACGAGRTAGSSTVPVTELGHGLSVQLPAGWQAAGVSLTPHLLDPREEMSVATFPLHYRQGRCAQFPSGTLEDLGPAMRS
jgi:hypothetical protein